MKPFAVAVLMALGSVVLCCGSLMLVMSRGDRTDVVQQAASPDGTYVATLMVDACCAAAGDIYETWVTLDAPSVSGKPSSTVFSFQEWSSMTITLRWSGPRQLDIVCSLPGYSPSRAQDYLAEFAYPGRRETAWRDVSIQYVDLCADVGRR